MRPITSEVFTVLSSCTAAALRRRRFGVAIGYSSQVMRRPTVTRPWVSSFIDLPRRLLAYRLA